MSVALENQMSAQQERRVRLSLEQVASYWRQGYLVCPKVVSAELCDAMILHAEELPTAREGIYDPVMQPHLIDPYFREILAAPAIVSMVADILGEWPDGLQTLFYFGRPAPQGFILHQDNYCVEAKDNDFLSTWIALTDVTPDNGCLRAYPGSHTKGILPVRKLAPGEVNNQFPNMTDMPQFDESIEPVDLRMNKGDLVVLHGNVLHCSYPNKSDRFRYAHLNTYIRPVSSFRPGNTARRRAEPLPMPEWQS